MNEVEADPSIECKTMFTGQRNSRMSRMKRPLAVHFSKYFLDKKDILIQQTPRFEFLNRNSDRYRRFLFQHLQASRHGT